jgi:hypothetical protein
MDAGEKGEWRKENESAEGRRWKIAGAVSREKFCD